MKIVLAALGSILAAHCTSHGPRRGVELARQCRGVILVHSENFIARLALAGDYAWMTATWVLVPAIYTLMSVATFSVFAWDKWCAKSGRSRVPESTLHVLELFGGWPGALLAQRVVQHKSAKKSFIVVLWFVIALHAVGWGLFVVLALYSSSSGA